MRAVGWYLVILGLVALFLYGVDQESQQFNRHVCSTLDASTPAGQECP